MEKKLGKRYGLELAVGAAVLAASTITAYLLMRKDRRLLEEKVKAFIHLGERYRHLTGPLFDTIPQRQLYRAVTANLDGKLKDAADPNEVLSSFTPEQSTIYIIHDVCRSIVSGGFIKLFTGEHSVFAQSVPEIFEQVGAHDYTDILSRANAIFEGGVNASEFQPLDAAFLTLLKTNPISQCCGVFISEHRSAFLDA